MPFYHRGHRDARNVFKFKFTKNVFKLFYCGATAQVMVSVVWIGSRSDVHQTWSCITPHEHPGFCINAQFQQQALISKTRSKWCCWFLMEEYTEEVLSNHHWFRSVSSCAFTEVTSAGMWVSKSLWHHLQCSGVILTFSRNLKFFMFKWCEWFFFAQYHSCQYSKDQ